MGTVVIGGGSGFIGTALSKLLKHKGYDVLIISRKPGVSSMSWRLASLDGMSVNFCPESLKAFNDSGQKFTDIPSRLARRCLKIIQADLNNRGLPKNSVAVVNLAGQNVLDPTRRWTPGFKQNVWSSRVKTTSSLADAIKKLKTPPKVFASISGVGFYKPSADAEYTEESPGGNHDFLSQLCRDWEEAGKLPNELNVRRVIIRSGVVLGRQGGMVKQMFWPFYFGVGGPVGSGTQFMPWIHVEDAARLFVHVIESDVTGVLNGVAPQVITNLEFTKAFARAMWRPAFIPLPVTVLNLAFSQERAIMMTEGQKVIPKRTLESGYQYCFPEISEACKQCARIIYSDNV